LHQSNWNLCLQFLRVGPRRIVDEYKGKRSIHIALTKAEKKVAWPGLFEEEGGEKEEQGETSEDRGEEKLAASGAGLLQDKRRVTRKGGSQSLFDEFQQLVADTSPADTPSNRISIAKFVLMAGVFGFTGALVLSSFLWWLFGGIAFWSATVILLTLLGGHGIKNARGNVSMAGQMELVFATYGLAAGAGVATCLSICLSWYFFLAVAVQVAAFRWATATYSQPMQALLKASARWAWAGAPR
jgi:hypothetical protein